MFSSKCKTVTAVLLTVSALGTSAVKLALPAMAAELSSPKQDRNEQQPFQPLDERLRLEKEVRQLRAELDKMRAELDRLKSLLTQTEAGRKLAQVEKEGKANLVLKVHPLVDLVPDDETDELMHVIVKSIEPGSWGRGGGSISYFSEAKCLVISQSVEIHQRVQALLDALAKAKSDQKEKRK